MKLTSANLLKAGKRELRSLGDDCDDACFPAYCCGNFGAHGICRGFKLLNGENRKKLNAMLTDDDVLYIESCMRMIQNENASEDKESLVEEVLRYLPEAERQPKQMGFTAMLTAARSNTPTSHHTESVEPRLRSGFIRMLEESSKKTNEDAIQKALDEIEQDEAKYRRPTRRGMGFGNMLKASQTGTFEGDEERDSVRSIPTGFRAMLESMSPTRTREIVEERPHVRRGLGFANMLECAFKGTE